ncbi:hypothetical protein Clacol_008814 [Clathrus columnatus]|uniref:Phenylalanine ammonia-lyase n=1 Tax=Clathrus columnatus TaxID=1419009 RepID=A0AAV5AIU0_9AGAM|nr:hypothetical protein Clacol_008814 [Clathrus columnatus]
MSSSESATPFLNVLRQHWDELSLYRDKKRQPLIDGETFTLAGVLATARFRVLPVLGDSPTIKARVQESANFAQSFVDSVAVSQAKDQKVNKSMYGVTTGFGGSANTRLVTTSVAQIPQVLVKGLQAGIIPPPSRNLRELVPELPNISYNEAFKDEQDLHTLEYHSLLMPEMWVKGTIAVRLNCLIRGYSGCRYETLVALYRLLVHNITPCPPLRMSISASGDLGPLAYIAGAVTGEGKTTVWCGEGSSRAMYPASYALRLHSVEHYQFLPKEALAIVNGTATSCAVAACVLHDASFSFLMSQALTALSVEALRGTSESFTPFLHDTTRPHPGQIEVAQNIRRALEGSELVVEWNEDSNDRLRQDRYSLRTAPQWIGPQIEEALAALQTLTIEINSTTDNPIIDSRSGEGWRRNLCGGNFQGTSITVAMEKIRVGLQHIGRIAYAQMVELGQPSMSRGLPPDVAANEPSLDYGQKALDMACASYLAELSFVCNTVSNHVQPAELHNQSVNSLALVSARYTATAVQLIQMIHANLLVSLCQALDIRFMYQRFFTLMHQDIANVIDDCIKPVLGFESKQRLISILDKQARTGFSATCTLDSPERFLDLVRPLVADIFTFITTLEKTPVPVTFSASEFHQSLATRLTVSYKTVRYQYFSDSKRAAKEGRILSSGTLKLGKGTLLLYEWVRKTIGVPMRFGIAGGDNEETDSHLHMDLNEKGATRDIKYPIL